MGGAKVETIYNFSAGPAMLPGSVLDEASLEMRNYRGSGMSVMEMSHRSTLFRQVIETAEQDLRDLLSIPDNYTVLFLQGGASTQFAMVPMNLMKQKQADFLLTGVWAKRAYAEASLYGDAKVLASGEASNFAALPDYRNLAVRPDSDYVYICENNTIYGTKFPTLPDTSGIDLVSDQSSCFLSEPINVRDYAVIFAGAQKNVGPAGVTIVIIRDDLITEDVLPFTPTMLRYKTHADHKSLYNTPPAYGIYICGKVFSWQKQMGGLDEMARRNREKAALLYDYLDSSSFFSAVVQGEERSSMNVPFVTGQAETDKAFIQAAKAVGLENLGGHRSVGGMRASIYNAMPLDGVKRLIQCMEEFEKEQRR